MKNLSITLLLLGTLFNSYGQIQFDDGYFIDNNDRKRVCLIKNVDWRTNPSEFEYKLSLDGLSQTTTISEVKEFGITNFSKYVRENVYMDTSAAQQSNVDNDYSPHLALKTLFLKVLLEGEASLYSYTDKNSKLFFYKTASSPIQQLIYKQFKKSNAELGVNNSFRQQLSQHIYCDDITDLSISRMNYSKKDLKRHFIQYNTCKGSAFEDFDKMKKSTKLHLKLTPGINYSSLSISTEQNILADTKENAELDSEFNFRIGVELEIILPFQKNKWGLVIEPTFQQYKTQKELVTQSVTVDYKSIEFPFGLRYNMFLKNQSKLYVNAFAIKDFSLNSKIDYERSRSDFDVNSGFNFALGAGFCYNKISGELRLFSKRNIINKYILWDSNYTTISFIVGYKIF